jgi:hypothetical protein
VKLTDFATTERQRLVCELAEKMSIRKIAKELGLHQKTVFNHLQAVKVRASLRGWSPSHDMTKTCPETHYVKGTSTLYGADGEQKLQWVKTNADQDRLRLFAEQMAKSVCESVPAVRKVSGPKKVEVDALAVYPIGDAHIGMYAWGEECGDDYNTDVASRVMRAAFEQIFPAMPNTEQAVIINLGDWFHTDTPENETRRSGNSLDVDTRWSKVIRDGVEIMKMIIGSALKKHGHVRVINEIGNHDDQSSLMLSMVLAEHYRNEPRLEVDMSPSPFHWHEFGNNLIGVHHGNRCKPDRLYQVMHEDKREECGRCRFRYWYTGHVHQIVKHEIGGVVIESFRTLAARDAYASGSGYRSGRDQCAIVLDREYGECFRSTVNVGALR